MLTIDEVLVSDIWGLALHETYFLVFCPEDGKVLMLFIIQFVFQSIAWLEIDKLS